MHGRAGPGIYLAEYVAAEGTRGSAQLQAKANGQLATMDIPIVAPAPGAQRPFWRTALGPQRPCRSFEKPQEVEPFEVFRVTPDCRDAVPLEENVMPESGNVLFGVNLA